MINVHEVGKCGEDIATKYLKYLGYKIIERNYRCKAGEIDIIALDKYELVFVEVKTRSNLNYGRPAEAVNFYKKKHLYKVAKYYLYKNGLFNSFVRFDIVEVYIMKKRYKIEHLKKVDI